MDNTFVSLLPNLAQSHISKGNDAKFGIELVAEEKLIAVALSKSKLDWLKAAPWSTQIVLYIDVLLLPNRVVFPGGEDRGSNSASSGREQSARAHKNAQLYAWLKLN